MTSASLDEAVAYAFEHLSALSPHDKNFSFVWAVDPRTEFGIGPILVEGGRLGKPHIRYLMDLAAADRLLHAARSDMAAFDLACNVCATHLLHGEPIPDGLVDFAVGVLAGLEARPKAAKGYRNRQRDRVLARLIWETWVLFDLTEMQAREAVHAGARRAGWAVPADLRDIWEASRERAEFPRERIAALKRQVAVGAADRLVQLQSVDRAYGK